MAATFETFQFIVEATPCNGSDCHGHPGNDLNLIPTGDELYEILTTTVAEKCENLPVVNPGDPENSALVRLLKGPCGELPQMPDGCIQDQGSCLPPQYVKAVEDWIAAGAPK